MESSYALEHVSGFQDKAGFLKCLLPILGVFLKKIRNLVSGWVWLWGTGGGEPNESLVCTLVKEGKWGFCAPELYIQNGHKKKHRLRDIITNMWWRTSASALVQTQVELSISEASLSVLNRCISFDSPGSIWDPFWNWSFMIQQFLLGAAMQSISIIFESSSPFRSYPILSRWLWKVMEEEEQPEVACESDVD